MRGLVGDRSYQYSNYSVWVEIYAEAPTPQGLEVELRTEYYVDSLDAVHLNVIYYRPTAIPEGETGLPVMAYFYINGGLEAIVPVNQLALTNSWDTSQRIPLCDSHRVRLDFRFESGRVYSAGEIIAPAYLSEDSCLPDEPGDDEPGEDDPSDGDPSDDEPVGNDGASDTGHTSNDDPEDRETPLPVPSAPNNPPAGGTRLPANDLGPLAIVDEALKQAPQYGLPDTGEKLGSNVLRPSLWWLWIIPLLIVLALLARRAILKHK